MNNEEMWLQVKNRVPFRSTFLFWDLKDKMLIMKKLKKLGVKVRHVSSFTKDGSDIVGIFISCWNKDFDVVIQTMHEADKKLMVLSENYVKFKNDWLKRLVEEKIR